MADVEAARRALEDALGTDEVLSDPLSLRLYARDASMVEGGCALVAFPRSTEDVVACVRIAAEHGLLGRPPRVGHRARRRRQPDRRRARRRDVEDDTDPGGPARGPARLGRARRPEPRSRARAPERRLHVRARSVVAADLVDRRQREHERGRAALPRVRRDLEPRRRARRRPVRRQCRAARIRGARGRRLRPALRRRRRRGDPRDRRGRLRSTDAVAARRPNDPVRLRARGRLRRNGERDHRQRRRPRGGRDDGPRDRRGGRGVRARRLPDRRRRDPHRRGRRDARGRRGAVAGGRGGRARERDAERAGRGGRGRARADLEGTEVRVRGGGADRPALPPARLRRSEDQARRGPRRASTRSPNGTTSS